MRVDILIVDVASYSRKTHERWKSQREFESSFDVSLSIDRHLFDNVEYGLFGLERIDLGLSYMNRKVRHDRPNYHRYKQDT